MSSKSFSLLVLLIAGTCIFGCKGAIGPAGPSLTGNVTGFVTLIQSDGTVPATLAGVSINVDNTSYTATTDSTGKWTIDGLSTGIYSYTFSKAGYGIYRVENQQFVGGGTIYEGKATLAQPPNFTVAIDSVSTDSNSVYLAGTISGFNRALAANGYMLLAFDTGTNISVSNPSSYQYANLYLFGAAATSFSTRIYSSYFDFAGLPPGTKAYVVAYPLSYAGSTSGYTSYIDQSTGRTVYTSTGTPSSVFPVTIP